MRFQRTNFLVSDLDRALVLYRDILGMKVDLIKESEEDSYSYDVFEIDQSELPEGLIPVKGVSDIKLNDGFYVVVNIKEVIEPNLKEFDEVRGTVISDFQTEIEKKWMQSLRDKYEVKINNKSLKKLKKKLDN